ncbi:MAG: bacterial transcriptional activator domain-containing protein [Ilumatobacteraceae bacterium]
MPVGVPQGWFPEAEHIFLAMLLAWLKSSPKSLAGAPGSAPATSSRTGCAARSACAVDLLADQADGADGQVVSGSDVVAGDDVRLTWLGSAKVDHGAPELAAAAAPEWRRARVRQLLAILALRRRIARSDLAEWSADRAGAGSVQSASHSTYARRVLGDLAVDTRRRVLIDTAGVLELVPHRRIGVDLWEYEAAVADADQAERRGDIEAAAVALDRAFGFWGGRPLVDLEYDDRAAPQLQALRADLCRSAVRCGELRLARGDVRGALETVESVLDLDPAWEPAHRLAIAVAARSGGHVTWARVPRAAALRSTASAALRCRHPGGTESGWRRHPPSGRGADGQDGPTVMCPEALDARWAHRLVELVAPRGAGKSSAVAESIGAWSGSTCTSTWRSSG